MHAALADIRDVLQDAPAPLDLPTVRRAAVAMVLDPALNVLLMQRAQRVGDPWSGHLSFPGGHVDPDDSGDLAAAIRETHEEVGLVLTQATFLGALTPISTVGRRIPQRVIAPFVFGVPELVGLVPNEEVAALHVLPLSDLLRGVGRTHFTFDLHDQSWRLPRVEFSGGRLWGLTLQIVDELLDRLDGQGLGLARPLETP